MARGRPTKPPVNEETIDMRLLRAQAQRFAVAHLRAEADHLRDYGLPGIAADFETAATLLEWHGEPPVPILPK